MLKFYWYAKCSTCQKAKKALDANGISYQAIDITLNPPKASDFKKWLKNTDLELKNFLNTNGVEYRKLGGKELLQSKSTVDLINLLANNGRLVKRPIISKDNAVSVGFREPEKVIQKWKK